MHSSNMTAHFLDDRTLSGTGMKLVFKSTRSGERVRTVTGRLVKTAR